MTDKKRIEELERRVSELEARPYWPPVIIVQPAAPPPINPWQNPWTNPWVSPWRPLPIPFADPFWMVPPPGTPGTFTC